MPGLQTMGAVLDAGTAGEVDVTERPGVKTKLEAEDTAAISSETAAAVAPVFCRPRV